MDEGNGRALLHKDSRCAIHVGENGALFVHLNFMTDWVTEFGFTLLIAQELSIDFKTIFIESHSSNPPKPDEINLLVHDLKVTCINIKRALTSRLALEKKQKVELSIQRSNL
jgi:hypothetical protein